MKKIGKVVIILLFGSGMASTSRATDVVWSPVHDFQAENLVDECNAYKNDPARPACRTPIANPDFPANFCQDANGNAIDVDDSKIPHDRPLDDCRTRQTNAISNALQTAYLKGIRVIDIPYYLAETDIHLFNIPGAGNCNTDPTCRIPVESLARVGDIWLDAVEDFNAWKVSNGDYFKVRVRVPAFGNMFALADNEPNGNYTDLFQIPTAIHECTGLPDPSIPDLANPKIRTYVGLFTKQVLNGAKSRLKLTKIQEVTLALEGGWESDLFGDDNCPDINGQKNAFPEFTSFSNGRYPGSDKPFQSRANFFKNREALLKATYQEFASAANSIDPSIKPAIFLQTWTMDDRIRGTFDLYDLLKGTGIRVLHHDDFVNDQNPYDAGAYLSRQRHQEDVAEAETITRTLGIGFDEELSWAHYPAVPPPGTANAISPAWVGPNPPDLTNMHPENAVSFSDQVIASIQFGGTGFTYANWEMASILYPPTRTNSLSLSYFPPPVYTDPSWKALIGSNPNTGTRSASGTFDPNTGDAVNDHFLYGTGGLISTALANPMARATKAIYLSTLGRMEFEESKAKSNIGIGAAFTWGAFQKAGFDISELAADKQVDIISDAMIRDGAVNLDNYTTIFLPAETSNFIDILVMNKFSQRANNSNIVWDAGGGTVKGFSAWKSSVKIVNSPITAQILSSLLLQ